MGQGGFEETRLVWCSRRGGTTSPKNFRFDRERAAASALPFRAHNIFDRIETLLYEISILDIREIGEAKDGIVFFEFIDQEGESRLPLRTHLRGTGREYRVRHIEPNDLLNRGTEAVTERLTARRPSDLRLARRHPVPAGERPVV